MKNLKYKFIHKNLLIITKRNKKIKTKFQRYQNLWAQLKMINKLILMLKKNWKKR